MMYDSFFIQPNLAWNLVKHLKTQTSASNITSKKHKIIKFLSIFCPVMPTWIDFSQEIQKHFLGSI